MELILRYKNIVAAAVAVLVVLFAAKKIYFDYLNSDEELNNKMGKVDTIEVLVGNLEEADNQLKDLKTKIFDGDVFDFKKLLERDIESSSITIQSFEPRIVKEREEYRKMEVAVDITANYKGLTKFIYAIEDVSSGTIIRLDRRGNDLYAILFGAILK